jgi:uncharacterized BrkB/YihY/UPF0761 family membrane protein
MTSRKLWGASYLKLREMIERSVRNFARHDMAVYATALAYRRLLALFPFTMFLVAAVSFLRVDAVIGWLADQGPPGTPTVEARSAPQKVKSPSRRRSRRAGG